MDTTPRKRAAIYVRTSTGEQGKGGSPAEQETDCRELAAEKGLNVVRVYRDIAPYRLKDGGPLIEPGGGRVDRPGLNAILDDAKNGRIDVIIAWREDRLYRSIRAMLLVLDVVQEQHTEIELASQSFDATMAPVRAWLAQMELENIRARTRMGIKKRARDGKPPSGQDRYGYRRVGNKVEVIEEEAFWVRKIYEWYLAGVSYNEIRNRLINAGAIQKQASKKREVIWSHSSIQTILLPRAAKQYALGIQITKLADGDAFECKVPAILDKQIYAQVLQKRKKNRFISKGPTKHNYLLRGLIYCACGRKWGSRINKMHRSNTTYAYAMYYCTQRIPSSVASECPRTIKCEVADKMVWEHIATLISNPEMLMEHARAHIKTLQAAQTSSQIQRTQLQEQLTTLRNERQNVITWALKGRISEEDLDAQLQRLTTQEDSINFRLRSIQTEATLVNFAQWEQATLKYLGELRTGIKYLSQDFPDKESKNEAFALKRRIIESLVDHVEIDKERNLIIFLRLDIVATPPNGKKSGQKKPDGFMQNAHVTAYCDVTYDGYQAPSILQVPGAEDVAVEFNSLSKTFNMAGWRMGVAVGNAEALGALARIKSNIDSGFFYPVQIAAIEALAGERSWISDRNARYQARRDCVLEALAGSGLQITPPRAALYIWAKLREGWGAEAFARALLERQGVSVTPGPFFGSAGEGYIRIALTAEERVIQTAVQRIKEFLG